MLIKPVRNTLKKSNILKKKDVIVKTLKYGKLFKLGSIKFNILMNEEVEETKNTNSTTSIKESNYKVAFLVNKRLSKKAVTRNYIKRVLREFFRLSKGKFPSNSNIIISVTVKYDLVTYEILKQDFDGLLASEKYNDFLNKTLSENVLTNEGK